MDLLIVRHAIAFERDSRRWRDDGERPLSPEGMVRARKAAAGLKNIAERPQCVLSSPLVRARQTAAILTEFAGWPKATRASGGLVRAAHGLSHEQHPSPVPCRTRAWVRLPRHENPLGSAVGVCLEPLKLALRRLG